MSITNNLNVWAESGTYDSSTDLATKANTGFVSSDYLVSNQFNGILRESSLICKSFIEALKSLNTSSTVNLTVDNTLSVSDIAPKIADIFNKLQITATVYRHELTFDLVDDYQGQHSEIRFSVLTSSMSPITSLLQVEDMYCGAISVAEIQNDDVVATGMLIDCGGLDYYRFGQPGRIAVAAQPTRDYITEI